MLKTIDGLSSDTIDRVIAENLFEQIRYYRKSADSILFDDENIIKFKTAIPLPFFNCVLHYDLDKSSLVSQIRKFREYGLRQKTSLLWLQGPLSIPEDIEDILSAEGFFYDDHMWGMAADIDRLHNSTISRKEIPGFRIETVTGPGQLSGWIYACLKGFNENGASFQKIYDFEVSLGLGTDLPWIRFTGMVDDRPVASSAVFMGSKAAGIDNVATIPQWRKKGIGELMVRYALMFSRSRGYRVGVLHASHMGLSLYRHLGFRTFAETKEFIWKFHKQADKG